MKEKKIFFWGSHLAAYIIQSHDIYYNEKSSENSINAQKSAQNMSNTHITMG